MGRTGTARQARRRWQEALLAVLRRWSFDTGRGYSGLPQGMLQLSNALRDDLHDAERVD